MKRFENYGDEKITTLKKLDEDTLNSTIRRFNARLTHHLYGNAAKHKNKQDWARPLLFIVVEGRNTHKLQHIHAAIGNIPAKMQESIGEIINKSWRECEFANEQTCIKNVYDAGGWVSYITKEIGYTDNDALQLVHTMIPANIK